MTFAKQDRNSLLGDCDAGTSRPPVGVASIASISVLNNNNAIIILLRTRSTLARRLDHVEDDFAGQVSTK
jgi:hypothetical protein